MAAPPPVHRPLIRLVAGLAAALLAASAVSPGSAAAQSEPLPVDDPAVTDGLAWHLDATGARVAWRASLGAKVVVAVVDSGVDSRHPDLAGQVLRSISCVGAAGDPDACRGRGRDLSGHGTHVAGIIAARADDGTGVAGVAPRAQLLAVRALSPTCDETTCLPAGDPADLAAGVRWAVAHHADVINLSVTSEQRIPAALADAIDEAWAAGAIPVLAAGNRGTAPLQFDAPAAVVVTATTRTGTLAPYAPPVDVAPFGLAAPGGARGDTEETCHLGGRNVGVLSTWARTRGDRSGYACLAGTSMAAPQVSGGLALLLSMGYTRDEAVQRLIDTARPGDGLGAGQIDLAAATAGPLPSGVRFRHDAFDNGARRPTWVPPATGPFSNHDERTGPRVPLWAAVLAGGAAVGLATEATLRVRDRRRTAVTAGGPPAEREPGAPPPPPPPPHPPGPPLPPPPRA